MNAAQDTVIPLSVLCSRFENHRALYREKLKSCRWWEFKKRQTFATAAAVYDFEREALLHLGGATVLHRLGLMK